MEYEVLGMPGKIDFAPKSKTLEILQNIRTIITTPKYSVPLNRDFGLNMIWLDEPLPAVQAKLTAEIIQEVSKWEPRAQVTQVDFYQDPLEGVLRPKVRVRIDD